MQIIKRLMRNVATERSDKANMNLKFRVQIRGGGIGQRKEDLGLIVGNNTNLKAIRQNSA
jgi:hypothetical protein